MWSVDLIAEARSELRQIDRSRAAEIVRFLQELAQGGHPRASGQGVSFLWRYIVADHQVFAEIRDGAEKVIVTTIRPLPF